MSLRPVSNRSVYYNDSGYPWVRIKKGKIKAGRNKDKPVWMEEGGKLYYTCFDCGTLNQISSRNSVPFDFRIIGRDYDTHSCEVCSHCELHVWFTLVDAVPEKVSERFEKDKSKCPVCKKTTVEDDAETTSHFDDGGDVSITTRTCYACKLFWVIREEEY